MISIPSSADLREATDIELAQLVSSAIEEQKRRALEGGDTEALVEEGFVQGFNSKGEARIPWLHSGFLVCPGSKQDRSSLNHECTFVRVNDQWVWESADKILDEVRNSPGPRPSMKSVTLILASEGLEVDVITSRTKNAVHEMKSARSYVVKNGELELVNTRTPKAADRHR